MSKLMKDDAEYTYAELPRINSQYKVTRWSHDLQLAVSQNILIKVSGS